MTHPQKQVFNTALFNIERSDDKEFPSLLAEFQNSHNFKEKDVVTAKVVDVNADYVIFDVGLKDWGRVSTREFFTNGKPIEVAIGDRFEVEIENLEKNGELLLSRENAVKRGLWASYERAMNDRIPLMGVITGRVKGGLGVDLSGVPAFLPGSQVDLKPVRDIAPLVGVEQPFIILKMDKENGNVVVSRKALVEQAQMAERSSALSAIKVGDVYDGVVKNLTNYGAFVSIGKVDGLLHVTDMRWTKVNHPSEMLTVGQHIKVQVTRYDSATHRVSLGMKQLEANPWAEIAKNCPPGTKMSGTVTNITDYGAFVDLGSGVDGLVHVSEMAWGRSNVSPYSLVKVGDVVQFVILDIDQEKHRVSLGMKQCSENLWIKTVEQWPAGSVVDCTIQKILDYGLVVSITDEVEGLVQTHEISWTEDSDVAMKHYKIGDVIKAQVLSVDMPRERLNLSIKRLGTDTFSQTCKDLKKGGTVLCLVKEIHQDGILVEVGDYGMTSLIRKADLSNDRMEQRPERFAVNDRVEAQVVRVDRIAKKIALSIKALEREEQQRKIAEYGSETSGASLSSILGHAIKLDLGQGAEE